MPSTIVHMAFAGMVAAGLLGTAFDRRSVLLVLAAIALIDLDAFIPLILPFGHRAVLHNLVIPIAGLVVLLLDGHVREESYILERWGAWGYRVVWVTLLCYAVAGVLLDLTDGIVNLLWPIHDQFYSLDGRIELSDQQGIVQTFIEFGNGDGPPTPEAVGSTEEVEVTTGVDPGEPAEPDQDPERIFPVIGATWELVVFLTGTFVTAMRLRLDGPTTENDPEE